MMKKKKNKIQKKEENKRNHKMKKMKKDNIITRFKKTLLTVGQLMKEIILKRDYILNLTA